MMSEQVTAHLHWQGLSELDLICFCQFADGSSQLVSFADDGTLEQKPFVQLLSDYKFQEVPTDNQEIAELNLSEDTLRAVWFFTWDFEQVEAGVEASFEDYELYLELRQKEGVLGESTREVSKSMDEGEGNAICLGCWHREQVSEGTLGLQEINQRFMMPLLEGMEEVEAKLDTWVKAYQAQ